MGRVLTRIEVDEGMFRERAKALGFPNVESIAQAAKAQGVQLSVGTIYKALSGGNVQLRSLELMAQVTNISLDTFLTFQPQAQRQSIVEESRSMLQSDRPSLG